MTDLEKNIAEKIFTILPQLEKLEFRGNIGVRSHSVEFYATFDGKRMQCYDMVDAGILSESKLTKTFRDIADFVRSSDEFNPGKITKISFACDQNEGSLEF